VTSLTLPAASYGRNTECPETAVDQYQVLFQTTDFPASACTALHQLAASVQWAGGGDQEKYADCHALWPVSPQPRGLLIARLIDAGRDRLGRPHALRMDVVYVESAELVVSADEVASLLAVTAWPSLSWAGTPDGIQLTIGRPDPAVVIALAQLASEGRPFPRVFVARHPYFRASGFDLVFAPNTPSGRVSANSTANSQAPGGTTPTRSDATPSPKRAASLIGIVLLLLTLIGGGVASWCAYDHYQDLAMDRSRLQRELRDTQQTRESEALARQRISARLEDLQRKLKTEDSQVTCLTTSIAELDELLRDFKLTTPADLRTSSQAFGDAKRHNSQPAELERLRQADNTVDCCLKEMERVIKRLHEVKDILDQYRTHGPQHRAGPDTFPSGSTRKAPSTPLPQGRE
jgi:hypothetical protein